MANTVERVSRLLIEAHRRSRQIAEPPLDVEPFDRAEAFAIQDHIVIAMGGGAEDGRPAPRAPMPNPSPPRFLRR
jgi:hypothetical protein